jgi:NAD(P)-dependent dehydrogenase (short-subunit alcohol dehydrogenase family)
MLVSGDVADPKFCEAAVNKIIKAFGKLDILVNNAAFQQHATFDDLTTATPDLKQHGRNRLRLGVFSMWRRKDYYAGEPSSIVGSDMWP